MTVVLVEGESDRIALETLAMRMDIGMPRIRVVGGSKGARRAAAELARVDEAEFVRALGVAGVEAVIAEQGELESFRSLQRQPFQRARPVEAQLSRFFGGRSGNKARYARLLADAVPLGRVPPPLAALLASI